MWKITIAVLSFALLCASESAIAAAADASPSPAPAGTASAAMSPVDIARNRIDTMLRTGHADATWFSASFLAQIPASKVDEVIGTVESALGAYTSLDFTPEKFVAHFARGSDDVLIHLDAANKIDGLFFRPPVLGT